MTRRFEPTSPFTSKPSVMKQGCYGNRKNRRRGRGGRMVNSLELLTDVGCCSNANSQNLYNSYNDGGMMASRSRTSIGACLSPSAMSDNNNNSPPHQQQMTPRNARKRSNNSWPQSPDRNKKMSAKVDTSHSSYSYDQRSYQAKRHQNYNYHEQDENAATQSSSGEETHYNYSQQESVWEQSGQKQSQDTYDEPNKCDYYQHNAPKSLLLQCNEHKSDDENSPVHRGGMMGIGSSRNSRRRIMIQQQQQQPPDCSNLNIGVAATSGYICKTKSGNTGLDNLGNTCFMNAALQALAHTPALADFILSGRYKCFDEDEQKIAIVFSEVIEKIYEERNAYRSSTRYGWGSEYDSSFSPNDFYDEFTTDEVAPQESPRYRQHDSHELLRVLIDQLCDDFKDVALCRENKARQATDMELENMSLSLKADYWWKRHLAENSSFITDTFCGQLVSTIQCSVCKTNSYCFDPFYDISLPFTEGNDQSGGHQQNRRKGSRPSIKPSWLSMNNNNNTGDAKSCTLDDCLREFTKDEVLDGENKIECSSCRVKRTMVKRLQVFRFPQVLVLHLKRFGNSRKKIRTAVQFPITGFDASPLAYQNDTRPEYDLFAVVDHSGRMNFGHYTASCIDPQSEEWQQFNDEEVDGIETSDLNEANAYMLFYKIRES